MMLSIEQAAAPGLRLRQPKFSDHVPFVVEYA